jgi:hypothetical protein
MHQKVSENLDSLSVSDGRHVLDFPDTLPNRMTARSAYVEIGRSLLADPDMWLGQTVLGELFIERRAMDPQEACSRRFATSSRC